MDEAVLKKWIDDLPDDYDQLVLAEQLNMMERAIDADEFMSTEDKEEAKRRAHEEIIEQHIERRR